MFRETKRIVQSARSLEDAIKQTLTSAHNYPDIFNEPNYWKQTERHDFRRSFSMMTDWARAGLSRLGENNDCGHLILDLGDCPEIFRLYLPSRSTKFEDYDPNLIELCCKSVFDLNDEGLPWIDHFDEGEFHGFNGYFLWLVLGSLALIKPLDSLQHRQLFLWGREGLKLCSGFEGLYFHLATVTTRNVCYEPSQQPNAENQLCLNFMD